MLNGRALALLTDLTNTNKLKVILVSSDDILTYLYVSVFYTKKKYLITYYKIIHTDRR